MRYSPDSKYCKDLHPKARRRPVNTTHLQRDSSIRPGLDLFSGLSRYPERLTKPSFIDEVPGGMDNIWELMRILFDDADKAFCNAALASFTTISSHALTRLVISKASRNVKFQKLYRRANQSEAANYLINQISPHVPEHFGEDLGYPLPSAAASKSTTNRIDNWNFQLSTIKFNPLIKIFRNEVLNYVCPTASIIFKLPRIHFGANLSGSE